MALTIAIEGTGVIADADAISDTQGGTWFELGGGTIAVSNDVYLVGGASIGGKYASKSGIHAIDKGATTYDFTAGTGAQSGELIYIWVAMTAIGTLDTKANFGLCIRVSSGSSTTASTNYLDFLIAGNDDANGWTGSEWRCFVVDPTQTATRSNGTVASILASVQSIGCWIDCSTSARADSLFVGGIAIGSGLRITGTSTTGWDDAVVYCTDYATRGWGMLQEREEEIFAYGKFYIGDATSQAAAVSFTDSGRSIRFGTSEYWTGSAWSSFMPATASGIIIEDHTSYTTTFSDGVVVGTDGGRAGSAFKGNALLDISLDLYGGNNAASVTTLYGTQIKDCTGTIVSGNDADHKFYALALSGSGQFDPVGAPVIRNCIFSETDSTAGCVKWNESINIQKCNFIANTTGAAVEHPSAAGTPYTHTDLLYSGNTFDVNNTSGSAITVSKTGTSDPSTYTGSLVTYIGSSVTVKVTALTKAGSPIQSALVLLRASDGTGGLPFGDTVTIVNSGTTATVTHTTHGLTNNDFVQITGASLAANNGVFQTTFVSANSYTYTMNSTPGSSPTGTIKCTFVALYGTTDASGIKSASRVYATAQPVEGWTRKSTSSPFYTQGILVGEVSTTLGYDATGVMVLDE